MTAPDVTAALRGPWQAVLTCSNNYAQAIASLDEVGPDDEVNISIRRATARPDRSGFLPAVPDPDDVIELWDDLMVEDEDAPARWPQAQAMAAGLNAAAAGPSDEARHEHDLLAVIDERDHAHEVADNLAHAISAMTGVDIGEHSSENDPWQNALDAAGLNAAGGEQR